MKLISSIATATATALLSLFAVGTAQAAPQRQPWVASETMYLSNVAKDLGVKLYRDVPSVCDQKAYGMATTEYQLVVCLENHGGNLVELADTIRHEMIHIAQYCRGNGEIALLTTRPSTHLRYAVEVLGWDILGQYDREDWLAEGEAFSLAHIMEEHEIAELLIDNCTGVIK